MSHTEKQQMSLPNKLLTGFIHYNDPNNLTELFNVLKKFREDYGLKFSHQSNVNKVFFIISTEHLNALSEKTPFKISRYQTTSKYNNCDEETSNKLMEHKDSFLRMSWNQESKEFTFQSRTPFKVHGNLVRRIFRDSNVEFPKDDYTVLRNNSPTMTTTLNSTSRNEYKLEGEQNLQVNTQSTHDTKETSEGFEGFERVEKKTKKPTTSKVIKETSYKPKIRGPKTTKPPKLEA